MNDQLRILAAFLLPIGIFAWGFMTGWWWCRKRIQAAAINDGWGRRRPNGGFAFKRPEDRF